MNKPHVIIVGAGISGLCLALGLQKSGVSFIICERDCTLKIRPQGYRIKINKDGSTFLKNILTPELWNLFEKTCARTEIGMTRIDALTGDLLARIPGMVNPNANSPQDSSGIYTVDRTIFRDVLISGIQQEVQFGKQFERYQILPDGSVQVWFCDGSSLTGDMLVGADGVHSGVRKQYLPNHKIYDTEVRLIYGKTPLNDELLTKFPSNALEWITSMSDDKHLMLFLEPIRFNKDCFCGLKESIPQVPDYVYWVMGGQKSILDRHFDEYGFLSLSNHESADLSLDLTKAWSPCMRSMLELQDIVQTSTIKVMSALPEIPSWKPSVVTLIGDAIHPMSPSGGVGANTAIKDASILVESLLESFRTAKPTVDAIARYEEQMRLYAKVSLDSSFAGGKKLLNMKSPAELMGE